MHSAARDRRALTRQRYHFISDPAGGLAPALTVALGRKREKVETRVKSETRKKKGCAFPRERRVQLPLLARNAFRFLRKSYRRL